MNVKPVRPGLGESVGKDAPVLAEGGGGKADGAVLGERVRVQEELRLVRQRVLLVHHAGGKGQKEDSFLLIITRCICVYSTGSVHVIGHVVSELQ